MANASVPVTGFQDGEFRVGHVFSDSFDLISRNLLRFSLVTVVAALPSTALLLLGSGHVTAGAFGAWSGVSSILSIILNAVCEAIVLYAAFQDMRGRPVDMMTSVQIGLRRFWPVLGLAVLSGIATGFAAIFLVIPGLIVFTMWFVAMPACVVEHLGPTRSMGRSRDLTKGHRWKIFGLWLLVFIGGAVVQGILDKIIGVLGIGPMLVVHLVWSAIIAAFYAVVVVVTYHDLRVAKEGVDTDQIAAVFD